MKKKTEDKKLDNDLDFGDLEDLGSDIESDLGDLGNIEDIDFTNRKPSVREVAVELGKEAGVSFIESLATKTAEKALPDSYSESYYVVTDYVDFFKEAFEKNQSKLERSIYNLGKEVKKVLPFQFKMLDNFLEDYKAKIEGSKAQSEEQIRESTIQSTLNSIFNKQLEITQAIEAKRSAEEEVDKKQRLYITKTNLEVLSSIDRNIANQTAFTLQINKEYYRKSLELQYKSYFVQADILKEIKTYFRAFSKQFEDIQHNTSLPDFVKLHKSEAVAQTLQNQIVTSVYKQVFSNFEYLNKVKKRISSYIGEKVSDITLKIDSLTDFFANINQAKEMGGNNILLTVLSGLLGSTIGEKVAEKISPKVKDMIKDNKYINTGGNYLALLSSSPRTLFSMIREKTQKMREKFIDEDTPIKFVANKLLGSLNEFLNILGTGVDVPEIKKQNILTHDKPAIFDNKVHRSITEVIPLYLAKILKENTSLRQMYAIVNKNKLKDFKEPSELVYNYVERKLTTKDQFIHNVQKSVFKDMSKESKKLQEAANQITSTAVSFVGSIENKDKVDKETKKLMTNKKAQKAFQEYVIKASTKLKEQDFTYENIVNKAFDRPELVELIGENELLQNYIKKLKSLELHKQDQSLEDKIKDVKRIYPIQAIIELFNTASKFVKKNPSKLSSESANFIAETWLTYYLITKKIITLNSIIDGSCFKYMSNDYTKNILFDIQELMKNCFIIKNSGNIYEISTIEYLIGKVNESLLKAFEFNPEVFQKLYNYSPELVKHAKYSIDGTDEEKLQKARRLMTYFVAGSIKDSGKSVELVNSDVIKDLKKGLYDREKSQKEVQNLGHSIAESLEKQLSKINENQSKEKQKIDEQDDKTKESQQENDEPQREQKNRITKIFNELSSVRNADSVEDVIKSVRNIVKDIGEVSLDSAKKAYSKSIENFDKFTKEVKNITNVKTSEELQKVKNNAIITLEELIENMDKLINKENEVLRKQKNKFKEIRDNISKSVNDAKTYEFALKQEQIFIEERKEEIKALREFRNKLEISINELKTTDTDNIIEFGKKVKDLLESLLNDSKEILARFES